MDHTAGVGDRSVMTSPGQRPHLYRRQVLLNQGYTDGEILSARRSNDLIALRPGAYLERDSAADLDRLVRHRLLIDATLPKLTGVPVVSHLSSAALVPLDLWMPDLRLVHVTRATGTSRRTKRFRGHLATLLDDEITSIDGVLATTVARTVIDCARTIPFEQAVVLADCALHRGLVTPAELAVTLDRQRTRAGAAVAARVVAFADGRSESVGESRSRVMIARAGLPMPELQHPVFDQFGDLIGICDFWWSKQNLLGEFDGQDKYTLGLRPGEKPGGVVFREKLREDALRATGAGMIRWVWADLDRPARTGIRIATALGVPLPPSPPQWP